jgi:hypothetical protein
MNIIHGSLSPYAPTQLPSPIVSARGLRRCYIWNFWRITTYTSSIIHWNKSRIPGGDPLETPVAFGSVIYGTFEWKVTAHELSYIAIERFQGKTLASPAHNRCLLPDECLYYLRTSHLIVPCASRIGRSKPPLRARDRLLAFVAL